MKLALTAVMSAPPMATVVGTPARSRTTWRLTRESAYRYGATGSNVELGTRWRRVGEVDRRGLQHCRYGSIVNDHVTSPPVVVTVDV